MTTPPNKPELPKLTSEDKMKLTAPMIRVKGGAVPNPHRDLDFYIRYRFAREILDPKIMPIEVVEEFACKISAAVYQNHARKREELSAARVRDEAGFLSAHELGFDTQKV